MRNFKRITAVVMAVAMLLSLMSISAFAAGDKLIDLTFTADKTTIAAGESVDVSIDFTPKAAGPFVQGNATFEFVYDKDAFDAVVKSIDPNWEALTDVTPNFSKGGQFGVGSIMSLTGTKANIAVVTLTAKSTASGDYTIGGVNFNGNTLSMEAFDADITNATVKVGGSAPVPTAAPTAAPGQPTAAPTAAPTVAPTAAPTATPEPQAIKPSTSSAVVGKDFSVTITRTDASEEATVKVILTPAVEGAAPTVKEVTFPAGETKIKVTVTADEMEKVAAKGESFNISVLYNDEEVYTIDKKMSTASSSSGNSGLTTGSTGVTTPAPATAAPGTEPTTAPGTEPTVAPSTVVFEDVPATYWGYDYIMDLYNNGIVNGVTATQFMPESNVTRAEFTKMAVGIFGLTATSTVSPFSDVSDSDWFAPYVIAASEAGIVQGITDTEFGPDENITREQMATIIGRQYGTTSTEAVSFTDTASIESYALPYVAALVEAGYLTGDENGAFNPKNNATRAESAALLDRVYVSVKVVPEATAAPEATADPEATAAPEVSAEPEATATATPEAK
ncbi:MAG: S-layer homology domain-containing protein [Clostridiales bacterium]|nr:S-layer homology domain-containing protein [Clostridiales bacterium]